MSKINLLTSFVLGMSLILSGCSSLQSQESMEDSGSSAMSSGSDFDAKLAEVTAKYKELAKAGGAWVTSDDILEKATEAAKNKDVDKAMKLLKEADDEIELARAQFESQKDAKPHLF